jgi:hypothetical protein
MARKQTTTPGDYQLRPYESDTVHILVPRWQRTRDCATPNAQ